MSAPAEEKNEEAEFAAGPLSVLTQSVKTNSQVGRHRMETFIQVLAWG
jgi:hypothetical protein